MRRSNVVVAEGLVHVLVHFVVQRVKHVTSRTTHEVREAFRRKREMPQLAKNRYLTDAKKDKKRSRTVISEYRDNARGDKWSQERFA